MAGVIYVVYWTLNTHRESSKIAKAAFSSTAKAAEWMAANPNPGMTNPEDWGHGEMIGHLPYDPPTKEPEPTRECGYGGYYCGGCHYCNYGQS